MRKVAGYIRVSSEEQSREGISMDAQRARIAAYCTMRGLELAETIEDPGVSASKPLRVRPGGQRLLELLRRRKVAGIVAFKLDRLFRNCADCLANVEAWERAGIALHLIDLGGSAVDTSSAAGKFFLTVMAGAAELERNQISERTSAVLQHKATAHAGALCVLGALRLPPGKPPVTAPGSKEVDLECSSRTSAALKHSPRPL